MAPANDRTLFLESLERCARNDDYIHTFYTRFIESSDEVRHHFRLTDMKKQEGMLIQSLRLCAGAINGDREALSELADRARTHDRHHLNIEPHLYTYWQDTLMAVTSEFDPQWNKATESAWQTTLEHVVNRMVDKY